MSDQIGVAVVGAGYWGPNLVRNLQASPDVRLHWLCDLDEWRVQRALGGYSTVRTTSSIDDVLSDPQVHAVVVATPASTHELLGTQVLESGRHLLIEKPLASTAAGGERLVQAAAARDLVLMADHTYCYTPAVQKIRDLIAEGVLGDIQFVDSVRINLGLVQQDVDVLWDLAPHDLSILDFVLPSHVRPYAVAAQAADPLRTGRPCIAYLTLHLPDQAIAHAHVNWLSPTKIRTFIFGGAKRTLVWDDLQPSQRLSVFDRGVDLEGPEIGAEGRREALVSYRTGDMLAPALPEREGLIGVVEEFVAAIRQGRPARTDGLSAVRVLRVLEAAGRSIDAHGVAVPLAP